jgi:hypothetical protein
LLIASRSVSSSMASFAHFTAQFVSKPTKTQTLCQEQLPEQPRSGS